MDNNTNIKDLIKVLNEGIALQRQNQAAEAEDRYQQILGFESKLKSLAGKDDGPQGGVMINTMLSQVYNNLGLFREKEKNLNQANTNFRKALDYAPGSVEAQTSLSRIFFKQRNLQQAFEAAKKAVSLQPDYLPAVVQLCRAAFVLETPEEALQVLENLQGKGDKNVRLNTEYGRILEKLGRRLEAKEKYQAALALAPEEAYTLLNMGNVCFHLTQYGEALKHYQHILEINPEHGDALRNIGNVYQRMGLFREAEKTYQQALELNSADVEAYANFASLKEMQKDCKGALEMAETVLETPKLIQNLQLFALLIKARCERKLGKPVDAIVTAKAMLELSSHPDNLYRAYYELVRNYDARKKEKEAVENIKKANEAFLQAAPNFLDYDKSVSRLVHNLLDYDFRTVFPKEQKQQFRRYLPPVFVIGNVLSGTELLDQLVYGFDDFKILKNSGTINALRRSLSREEAGYPAVLETIDDEKVKQLRQHYFNLQDEMTTERQDKYVWNSYPLDLLEVPLITKIFPRAKFVFTYCHPLDSVFNAWMSPFILNETSTTFASLEKTTEFCQNTLQLWEKYKAEIPFDFIEVKYEDVLKSPKKEVAKILKFLDPEGGIAAHKELKKTKVLEKTCQDYEGNYPPLRWKRYDKHLQPALKALNPYIDKLGY